ncbi:hypothetical protein LTR10_001708 [Elasticomyces elasticus]|nr:hypothetical protein LTR10_001708 [Elasticomyces elasticus]KAK4975208.1 hypothetical protein LTR42_004418 [Elasticomyces elasticus]
MRTTSIFAAAGLTFTSIAVARPATPSIDISLNIISEPTSVPHFGPVVFTPKVSPYSTVTELSAAHSHEPFTGHGPAVTSPPFTTKIEGPVEKLLARHLEDGFGHGSPHHGEGESHSSKPTDKPDFEPPFHHSHAEHPGYGTDSNFTIQTSMPATTPSAQPIITLSSARRARAHHHDDRHLSFRRLDKLPPHSIAVVPASSCATGHGDRHGAFRRLHEHLHGATNARNAFGTSPMSKPLISSTPEPDTKTIMPTTFAIDSTTTKVVSSITTESSVSTTTALTVSSTTELASATTTELAGPTSTQSGASMSKQMCASGLLLGVLVAAAFV